MNELMRACGDKCSECPRFVATAYEDAKLLKAVTEFYVEIGHRAAGTDAETLKCRGCWSNDNCAHAVLRDCVVSKGIDNCGQCKTYPCGIVNGSFSKAEAFKERIAGKASAKLAKMFEHAFFRKKEYLDRIKEERKRQ